MSNVIDIEDYRRVWANWICICGHCGKEWVGTIHKDTAEVECPSCGKFTAMSSHTRLDD